MTIEKFGEFGLDVDGTRADLREAPTSRLLQLLDQDTLVDAFPVEGLRAIGRDEGVRYLARVHQLVCEEVDARFPARSPERRAGRDEVTTEELREAVKSGCEMLGGVPQYRGGRQALACHVATVLDVLDSEVTCEDEYGIDCVSVVVTARDVRVVVL